MAVERLETMTGGMGYALGADLKAEIARETERHRLVDEQIRCLEKTQRERTKAASSAALEQVNKLMELKAGQAGSRVGFWWWTKSPGAILNSRRLAPQG